MGQQIARVALVFLTILRCADVAMTQNPPLVVAFGAPHDTSTTCPPGGNKCIDNFINYELQYVSGIGIRVFWALIDDCARNGSGQAAPCQPQERPDNGCTSAGTTYYNFCDIDEVLKYYVSAFQSNTAYANKKIVLLVNAINDSSANSNLFTPDYVFLQDWANNIPNSGCHSGCPPQDIVACGAWQGNIDGGTCPVSGNFASSPYAVWNVNAGAGGIPNPNCQIFGSGLNCTSSACAVTSSLGGFPVVYEKPFMVAYQAFLRALVQHYSSITGNSDGSLIAPYIAYVRPGMAEGSENQPFCATKGNIQQDIWFPSPQSFPAGYVVNDSNTQYVATGSGTTGVTTSKPTCSPAGCTTAQDGKLPGWYNAASNSQGSPSNAIWPGPTGYVNDSQGYWDNGYLSLWPLGSKSSGQPGYIASMVTFLESLTASFAFDISAHNGPPSGTAGETNVAYADSEAMIASAHGVGFGMQSTSVYDSVTFALGLYPTSPTDWARNFSTYSAPVHHLQTFNPGGPTHTSSNQFFAAGFGITTISISSGVATINCTADCSIFTQEPIYVEGSSNPALDGIYIACPNGIMSASCPSATGMLNFKASVPGPGPYPGGTVWAADYWPIVMPFAVQHNASSIEVYECDLDYALGVYPNHITTTWVSDDSGQGGCAEWGLSGADPGYQASASDTRRGQPSGTNIRAGKSVLVNGAQF